MSTIHFVGGEKGGVGKSVVARLLSQYFIDKQVPYAGLDADRSHPTLSRYYADFTRPIDLDRFESADEIMELASTDDGQVLIDLPAQSQRFIDRWMAENDVPGMCRELGIGLLYWYVVDDGPDSVGLLDGFLDRYGDSMNCVVIKNHGRGCEFGDIDAILSRRLPEIPNLRHADLPSLYPATMRRIEKLRFSFWAAANVLQKDVEHLSLMERQRSRIWLQKAQDLFDALLAGDQSQPGPQAGP